METLLGCLETHPHAWTESARDHRELQPRDISAPQALMETNRGRHLGLNILTPAFVAARRKS
jgi:hypothetical protein